MAGCMFVSQHDCALPGFAGQEGYSQSDDTFWKVPIVSKIKNWRLYRNLDMPSVHGQSIPEVLISSSLLSVTVSYLKGTVGRLGGIKKKARRDTGELHSKTCKLSESKLRTTTGG